MRILFGLFFFFFSGKLFSQPPVAHPSSEIFQNIKKLSVLGSVLYVAAHPDDENTRLIAWLSNEKLYRTAYLSMTRGDGGQNLIGDEQGVPLGLIRTQELLAARRIDGGEQFFTTAFDFGYSKSPEETFQIWNHEKILADVVWIIRKFRPDVIITRFPSTGEGGHGHHTASAILAGEAFDAAGDSTRFPEQLKLGVSVWRPRRLLWNTFNFGSTNTIRTDQFKVDAGGYNPLLGLSYGEMAAESRSQHKSQGFGVSASRGVQYEYFKVVKGDTSFRFLLDGVDATWSRLQQDSIGALTKQIENNFSFTEPEKSTADLLKLYERVMALPASVWKEEKLKEIRRLILQCSGFFVEAYTSTQLLIGGRKMEFMLHATNRQSNVVAIKQIAFLGQLFPLQMTLERDSSLRRSFNIILPEATPISQPYWLREPMFRGSFNVPDRKLVGKPWNDPLSVKATLVFDGVEIAYDLPVQYKINDPVQGEVYQPVFVVPAVEVQAIPEVALSKNKQAVRVGTLIQKNDPSVAIDSVINRKSAGVTERAESGSFESAPGVSGIVHFAAITKEGEFDRYRTTISYPHIPQVVYFSDAASKIVGVDIATAGRSAGYIPGAGDKIPEALAQLGYAVTILNKEQVANGDLKKFDVIITGVRAYNVHGWLNDVYPQLMKYVKGGGVLFVQYNTNSNLGPVKAKIGPYPFAISRTRVTDETAPVNFVDTRNQLLNFPNKIVPTDFDGWVQERSIYHAAGFEENYKSLLSMHDPGEPADAGGLIYCNYGKGRFVYSGLVFFRQLPAGNPGAYRLFANLIANKKKGND